MSKRKLSFSNGGLDGYKIIVDDHDISAGVRRIGVDVDARGSKRPRVDVELAIDAIEVVDLGVAESDFMVSMSDEARAALVALGWTPPAAPALGKPVEIANLPTEVITLIHAVDRMRDDWAESGEIRQHELWQAVHDANDKVWNR